MARLIDADKIPYEECYVPDGDIQWEYKKALIAEKTVIDHQPTVDAVPVVHGRWVEKQEPIPWCEDDVDVFTVCSICNSRSIGESNYCPNCGAKMDLEVN